MNENKVKWLKQILLKHRKWLLHFSHKFTIFFFTPKSQCKLVFDSKEICWDNFWLLTKFRGNWLSQGLTIIARISLQITLHVLTYWDDFCHLDEIDYVACKISSNMINFSFSSDRVRHFIFYLHKN